MNWFFWLSAIVMAVLLKSIALAVMKFREGRHMRRIRRRADEQRQAAFRELARRLHEEGNEEDSVL